MNDSKSNPEYLDFLLGRLPEQRREELERRLTEDPSLAESLREWNGQDDSFVRWLQSSLPAAAYKDNPFLEEALRDLHNLAPVLVGPASHADALSIVPGDPSASMIDAHQETIDSQASVNTSRSGEIRGDIPPQIAQLGRYRIERTLGRGGMGAVYLAHDEELGRKVALKVPFVEKRSVSVVLERFKREARSAAALRHLHVCPVYDVGEIDGQPYLTMAYVEGETLSTWARQPHSQDDVLAVIQKVALAVHHAHQAGVIHRDLKPSNIMIDPSGEPMVMDFGLARRQGALEDQLTLTGQVMGTPAYMPPEQIEGRHSDMGPACDIYALGVVMYEVLTGRRPFESQELIPLISQIVFTPPPSLTSRCNAIEPALEAIVLKALAKKPADRWSSMQELAEAIQTYRLTAAQPLPLPAPHGQPKAAPDTLVQPATRGSRGMFGIGVALILLAMLGGAAWQLAGVIFKLDTPDGTLVLEINEPDAEVRVVDAATGKVEIVRKSTGETLSIAVAPGQKKLEVEKNGFKLYMDEFQIGPEEKTAITARLVPKTAVVPIVDPKPRVPGPLSPPPIIAANWKPIPLGESPFDSLDPSAIPAEERFDWQPEELVAVIGNHRGRHWYEAQDAAWSPNGRWVATVAHRHGLHWVGLGERRVSLWSNSTQQLFGTIDVPNDDVAVSCVFTPDGQRLIVAGLNAVWSYQLSEDDSGAPRWEEPQRLPGDSARVLRISKDGRTLAGAMTWRGTTNGIRIWDLNDSSPSLIASMPVKGYQGNAQEHFLRSGLIDLSPDGKRLSYCDRNPNRLVLVDLSGAEPREAAVIEIEQTAFCCAFSPDGKQVATSSYSGNVTLYDVSGESPVVVRKLESKQIDSLNMRFSSDGRWLVLGQHSRLSFWDLSEERVSPEPSAFLTGWTQFSCISPDGQSAVTKGDGSFLKWIDLSGDEPRDVTEALPPAHQLLPPGVITGQGMIPTWAGDRLILWNLTGSSPQSKPGPKLEYPILSATGESLLGFQNGKLRRLRRTPGQDYTYVEPFRIADRRTESFYGSGGWGLVKFNDRSSPWSLWNLDQPPETAKVLEGIEWPERVDHACVSPDGRWIAIRSGEQVQVWDTRGPSAIRYGELKNHPDYTTLCFSPDSRFLLGLQPHLNKLHILNLDPSNLSLPPIGRTPRGSVAAFTPDRRRLVVGGEAGHLEAWDLEYGSKVWSVRLPGSVHQVEVADDGRHVVTKNGNGTIYVFRISDLLARPAEDCRLDVAAEREVATWLASLALHCKAVTLDGRAYDLKDGQIPDEPFYVSETNLSGLDIGNEDLAKLKVCRGLQRLQIVRNLRLADLSPLTGLPLTHLSIGGSPLIKDLSPLRGMPLTELWFGGTEVTDLSPLEGMQLTSASIMISRFEDLAILRQMPLNELRFSFVRGVNGWGADHSPTQPAMWRYTTEQPAADWFDHNFDAAAWKEGPGNFGTAASGTEWTTNDLWARHEFHLAELPQQPLHLMLNVDDQAEVYINGVLAVSRPEKTGYWTLVRPTPQALDTLRVGRNVIAIHGHSPDDTRSLGVLLAADPEHGLLTLRAIPTLEKINNLPVADFWRDFETQGQQAD
jgi:WD40 repeat protein/predicted Ser/Thr protein kinase